MNQTTFDQLYHSDKPFSYSGKKHISDNNDNISKKGVEEFLSKNDIYSRYRQYKKPRKYSPIYVYKKRELFQADLVSFTNPQYVEVNEGFKYLLTVIDVFSKYAWGFPLKDKKCESSMSSFANLLSICGEKPEKLQTDRGSEFICAKFVKYLKTQNIHHYLSYSDRKCPVVERFNLTIQQILYKILDKKQSFKWIDFLEQAFKIYNSRKHSTIGMPPNEAEKAENEDIVRKRFIKKFNKVGTKPPKAKYKVGDTVRIWKYKRVFDRGYNEQFTKQYFRVRKILRNLPVIRYELEDIHGEKIIGSFFENELVPFKGIDHYNTEIIDSKGSGKNKKYLVRWVGWPDKFNEWLPAESLTDINHSAEQNDKGGTDTDISQAGVHDETVEVTGNNGTIDENKDLENTPPNAVGSEPQNMFYEPYNGLDTSHRQIKKQPSNTGIQAQVRHRSLDLPRRGQQNISSDRNFRRQKRNRSSSTPKKLVVTAPNNKHIETILDIQDVPKNKRRKKLPKK